MIRELIIIPQNRNLYPSGIIIEDTYTEPNSDITEFLYINTPLDPSQELKIVFVLPVKEGKTFPFFPPLTLIKDNLIFPNEVQGNVLFVQPVYTNVPWYANHPTDLAIQQETNTINFINFIKNRYSEFPSFNTSFVGFSKSGWGSISLSMKYPNVVDNLFIWDSPLGLENLTFGLEMEAVFVTDAHFDTYDLNTRLPLEAVNLENKGIFIGGYQLFQTESEVFTDSLPTYPNVVHDVDDTLIYNHTWNVGWMRALFNKVNYILN